MLDKYHIQILVHPVDKQGIDVNTHTMSVLTQGEGWSKKDVNDIVEKLKLELDNISDWESLHSFWMEKQN